MIAVRAETETAELVFGACQDSSGVREESQKMHANVWVNRTREPVHDDPPFDWPRIVQG